MKRTVKKIAFVLTMVLILSAFWTSDSKAQELEGEDNHRILVSKVQLDNGWTCWQYIDTTDFEARAQGKGASIYSRFTDETGRVVCEVKATVGFIYGYDDDIVRITSFSYSTAYVLSGYSVTYTGQNRQDGSPAVASVSYTIYGPSGKYLSGSTTARCYNNGNVRWE